MKKLKLKSSTSKLKLKTAVKQKSVSKRTQNNELSEAENNLTALRYSHQILKRMTAKLLKDVSNILTERAENSQKKCCSISIDAFINEASVSRK